MTDLNKERSEFESIKEIQDSIRREQLIFNTKLGCYTKKSGKMCVSANWTNGAWFVFERKAKAQAVPEGYVVVPKDVAERTIGHISIAICHPNNTRDEENIMSEDQVVIERAIDASESGAEG
ncbi:hypothetical protein [Acinetobacter baumannii]|uniref:hypothetical protein n=1 Tax=Acinetobacter baumannii TaxID=470 RepID=UPI0005297B94|nr:hypothetical protein [Acinetobacter baumannii]EKV5727149.1 hypothetical protein [Acinetobacter baumannii]EMB9086201.1 hypothetical protein [Acinetobacter baumannii]